MTDTAKYWNDIRQRMQDTAASLYDGGWRADDREQLKTEYDFTEDELDELCKQLESMIAYSKSSQM